MRKLRQDHGKHTDFFLDFRFGNLELTARGMRFLQQRNP